MNPHKQYVAIFNLGPQQLSCSFSFLFFSLPLFVFLSLALALALSLPPFLPPPPFSSPFLSCFLLSFFRSLPFLLACGFAGSSPQGARSLGVGRGFLPPLPSPLVLLASRPFSRVLVCPGGAPPAPQLYFVQVFPFRRNAFRLCTVYV